MAKRYKVVGTQPILDHQPGQTFTDSIPADLEAYLLGIGGIKVVEEQKPKATKRADRF